MVYFNKNIKRGFGTSVIATVFLLQACAPQSPQYFQEVNAVATIAAQQSAVACNANTLQWMVGQNQSIIAAVQFEGPVRIIGAGEAVTMDYDPTRTNFQLDVDNRITTVTCG